MSISRPELLCYPVKKIAALQCLDLLELQLDLEVQLLVEQVHLELASHCLVKLQLLVALEVCTIIMECEICHDYVTQKACGDVFGGINRNFCYFKL